MRLDCVKNTQTIHRTVAKCSPIRPIGDAVLQGPLTVDMPVPAQKQNSHEASRPSAHHTQQKLCLLMQLDPTFGALLQAGACNRWWCAIEGRGLPQVDYLIVHHRTA